MSAAADIMSEARLCVGVIVGAHGVRGDLRVKSFTDNPEDLVSYGPLTDVAGTREFRLRVLGGGRGVLRVHMDGVDDRDAAEALAGIELYVARNQLPTPESDEFYHADLIGLTAVGTDGAEVGTVRAVHDFGAGDILEIACPEGPPLMLPFTRAAVPKVDIAGGRLVVDPPAERLVRPDDDAAGTDEGEEQ